MKRALTIIITLWLCQVLYCQQDESNIMNIRKMYNNINENISSFEKYDVYYDKNDNSYILVPFNKARFLDELDEISSLYAFGNDTMSNNAEYNNTVYILNNKIQLVEVYYSDYPEAMINNYQAFYFTENKLFFFYERYQETNYWVEPDSCCPSVITEHRYYYKDEKLIRALEKYLETTSTEDPDNINKLPNYEIYPDDDEEMLNMAGEFTNARILK